MRQRVVSTERGPWPQSSGTITPIQCKTPGSDPCISRLSTIWGLSGLYQQDCWLANCGSCGRRYEHVLQLKVLGQGVYTPPHPQEFLILLPPKLSELMASGAQRTVFIWHTTSLPNTPHTGAWLSMLLGSSVQRGFLNQHFFLPCSWPTHPSFHFISKGVSW